MVKTTGILLALTLATTARAQGVTASIATYGTFGLGDLDGDLPTSAELRLTIPISEKQAIEPFVTVRPFHKGPGSAFEGLYGAQILRRVGPTLADRNGYVFATYGAAGLRCGALLRVAVLSRSATGTGTRRDVRRAQTRPPRGPGAPLTAILTASLPAAENRSAADEASTRARVKPC